jgi:2-oxoglutarate/2-oxoacid ferredoxin oxidoreductase subunit alpha
VVEINRDGQLRQLLCINYPEMAGRFKDAAHMDGMPLSARWIKDEILSHAEEN